MHFHLSSLREPENKNDVIDEQEEKARKGSRPIIRTPSVIDLPGWLICIPELGVDNNLVRLNHKST